MANLLGIQKSRTRIFLLCQSIVLMFITPIIAFAAGGTMPGSGTLVDPFLVEDYADLKVVGTTTTYSLSAVYRLVADIDASASATENSDAGFIPIGNYTTKFTGTFHGGGHVIEHLYINRLTADYIGLFGCIGGGNIDSLGLISSTISGRGYVGGIIGASTPGSTINNCYSTGSISGSSNYVGGITGYSHACNISQCYNTGRISSSSGYVGGIVGYIEYPYSGGSTISNCYNTGTISGSSSYAGGINGCSYLGTISNCYNTGTISSSSDFVGGITGWNTGTNSNCYTTGNVSGSSYVGGIIGYIPAGTTSNCYNTGSVSGSSYAGGTVGLIAGGAIQYCYWNTQTSGQSSAYGSHNGGTVTAVTGLTTAQMKNSSNLSNLNFTSTWKIRNDSTYAGLQAMSDNAPFAFADTFSTSRTFSLSKLLLNDCDIETMRSSLTLHVISASRGITDSVSILTFPDSIARGVISTVKYRIGEIRAADTLWGNIAVAIVNFNLLSGSGTTGDPYLVESYKDLKDISTTFGLDKVYLLVADIDASSSASENGGAGFAPIGTEGSHFTGTFHGHGHVIKHLTINRPSTNGVALFGWNNGTIDSLGVIDGSITGYAYHTGCLAGWSKGMVKACYATGSVTGSQFVGCLVGTNGDGGTVSDCYATGSVVASNGCTGGLVGYNINGSSTVIRCYATGPVRDNSSNGAGGLVGYNSNGGIVNQSYASGYVTAPGRVGGLVGWNSVSTVNTSYWNTETSGQASGCGENNGSFSATGLTTNQMKASSIFSGWDFSSTWKIRADSTYPGLRAVDNAPFAFADTFLTGRTFILSQLFQNDCDIETMRNNLALKVISASRGITDSVGALTFPDSITGGAVSTLRYRVGEIRSADTLWGNIATAIVRLVDPPTITSFTPARNALNISKDANVTVTFSQNIDETTLTDNAIRLNGSLSGLHLSTSSYESGTHTVTVNPVMDFKVGEAVNIMLTRGIRTADGDSLTSPYSWYFNIKPNITTGTFKQGPTLALANQLFSVSAGDFDGDGDIDLVTPNSNANNIAIFSNDGSGTFTQIDTSGTASSPLFVTAGDFDRDGDIDIAAACYTGNMVSIHMNDGTGTFTLSSTTNVQTHPEEITNADFDGDGDLDIAVVNNASNSVSILLNDGSGTFTQTSTTGIGSDPRPIIAADLDRDGDIDLAVANLQFSTVSILKNNGKAGFSQTSVLGVGSNPFSMRAGDFDGDGDVDLATANRNSDDVSILLNDSTGTFTLGPSIGVGDYPWAIASGDFDGDGDIDLATTNGIANTVSILLNNGNGTFTLSSSPAAGTSIRGLTAADLNGDGDIDLALGSSSGNVLSILKNILASPQNLVVTDSSSNTVSIIWKKNTEDNFLRYRIYSDTTPNPVIKVDSTTGGIADTFKTFTGLKNGATYYFRITAIDTMRDESGFSNEVSAVPADRIPPIAPQNLTVADSSSKTITIKWQKNTEADFMLYRVYCDTIPNPTTKVDSMMGGIPDTVKTFTGLVDGMRYYFCVTAVDSAGNESGYSNEVNASPADRVAPQAPQNLIVTDSLGQTISIKWHMNTEADLMLYRIYCDTIPNPITKYDSTTGGISDTARLLNGLSVGMRYYFRVTAVDSASNESGYSSEVSAVPHTNITFIDGSWYIPPIAVSNTNDNPVGRFMLKADAPGAKLVSVNVTFSGSFSGVNYVKLCRSADSIFSGHTKLDSIPYSGSSITLIGGASLIDTIGTYFFVMVDLGASSGNIVTTITDNAAIILSAGTLIGTISNAPLAANPAIITDVGDEEQSIARVFALHQNYPNPFNPATTIEFSLEERCNVSLKIFDLLGREVATLVDGERNAGVLYKETFDASKLSSGIYIYRLQTANRSLVKKLMLMK